MTKQDEGLQEWQRLGSIQKAALAGRFLLELAGVAALVWWGIKVGTDDISRAGLALLAGGGLVVVWALVVAPKARNPLSPMTRWLIGTVLLDGRRGRAVDRGRGGARGDLRDPGGRRHRGAPVAGHQGRT
ncbi:MAG: DUF2568 domain-containing protein [Chloroflexota bacterium]